VSQSQLDHVCSGTLHGSTTYDGSNTSIQYADHILPSEDHIRLIRIYPPDPERPTRVFMTWRIVRLDEAPEYNALSYTWGPPLANPIPLKGTRITQNLLDCFLRLIYAAPGLWWIDALCINQDDHNEKNHQVKMMESIYGKAQTVWVWLGIDDEDTVPALQILRKLCKHVRKGYIPRPIGFYDEELEIFGLPKRDEASWISLMKFVSRPYFERIWVLQELIVAKEGITVMCGRYVLPWKDMVLAIAFIELSGWTVPLSQLLVPRHPHLKFNAFRLVSTVLVLKDDLQKESLEYFIGFTRGFRSTDPRDQIIALLGLVSPQDESAWEIEPDYGQDVAEFFRDITGKVIMGSRSFDLLLDVEDRSERKVHSLVSWVPDYSVGVHNRGRVENYNAAGGTSFSGRWAPRSNVLRVQAKMVDEVHLVADYASEFGLSIQTLLMSWFEMAARAASIAAYEWLFRLRNTHSPIDEQFEQFWRTMIGNRTEEEYPVSSEYLKHFLAFILPTLAEELGNKSTGKAWSIDYSTLFIDLARQGDGVLYSTVFYKNTARKVFFITKTGRMGLGPKSLQPGDQVAILRGGHYIYFLRKSQQYEFMGHGYVHGLMNGEGLVTGNASFQEIGIQ